MIDAGHPLLELGRTSSDVGETRQMLCCQPGHDAAYRRDRLVDHFAMALPEGRSRVRVGGDQGVRYAEAVLPDQLRLVRLRAVGCHRVGPVQDERFCVLSPNPEVVLQRRHPQPLFGALAGPGHRCHPPKVIRSEVSRADLIKVDLAGRQSQAAGDPLSEVQLDRAIEDGLLVEESHRAALALKDALDGAHRPILGNPPEEDHPAATNGSTGAARPSSGSSASTTAPSSRSRPRLAPLNRALPALKATLSSPTPAAVAGGRAFQASSAFGAPMAEAPTTL